MWRIQTPVPTITPHNVHMKFDYSITEILWYCLLPKTEYSNEKIRTSYRGHQKIWETRTSTNLYISYPS